VDLSKLTTGDKVIAVSGILLLVFSFLTWFEASVDGTIIPGTGESGWGNLAGILGILLGVALALIVLLPAFGVDIPTALTTTRTGLILGSVCFVAILITVFLTSYDAAFGEDPDTSRKLGAWLGLIAAAGVLAGAILKRKEGGAFTAPPAAPPAPPAA
jgi:hypothetical protein